MCLHCTSWSTPRSWSWPARLPLLCFESPRRRPSPEAPALLYPCATGQTPSAPPQHTCAHPQASCPSIHTVTECALTARRTCGERPCPAIQVDSFLKLADLPPQSSAVGFLGSLASCLSGMHAEMRVRTLRLIRAEAAGALGLHCMPAPSGCRELARQHQAPQERGRPWASPWPSPCYEGGLAAGPGTRRPPACLCWYSRSTSHTACSFWPPSWSWAASFLSCKTAACLSSSTRWATGRAASCSDSAAPALACLSSMQLDVELAGGSGDGPSPRRAAPWPSRSSAPALAAEPEPPQAPALDLELHLGAGKLS